MTVAELRKRYRDLLLLRIRVLDAQLALLNAPDKAPAAVFLVLPAALAPTG